MPAIIKKKRSTEEDFSFLPDQLNKQNEDFSFLPDRKEDTSFLPDKPSQPSILDRIKSKLPSGQDIGQAAVNVLPGVPPEAERIVQAETAGIARSATPILNLLRETPGLKPISKIGETLPEIAQNIEPQNQNFAEKFLSGQLTDSEILDSAKEIAPLVSKTHPVAGLFLSKIPTEDEIIKESGLNGKTPYEKIISRSIAEAFVASVRPLIPSNPVEAAQLVAIPKAINLLQADIPFLSRSLSDLIFKKKVVIPDAALPEVLKKGFDAEIDAYTGAKTGKPVGTAEARKIGLDALEREAAAARATAESQIRGQQARPQETSLPSTVAPGGAPATEFSIPGQVQRNVDVAIENLRRALGGKPQAPIETPGTVLGGGTPPGSPPGPASPISPGIPVGGSGAVIPGENVPRGELSTGLSTAIKPAKPVLPPSGTQFLANSMPKLAGIVENLSKTSNPESLQKSVTEAVAKAEAAKITGTDPAQAELAAIEHIDSQLRSGAIAPQIESQAPKKEAKFIGYQETGTDIPPFPLFNIPEGLPNAGSTVDLEGIRASGAEVPKIPSFKSWKAKNRVDETGMPIRRPGSVVSTVEVEGGKTVKITHQDALDMARSLAQEAKNENDLLRASREAEKLPKIRWTEDLARLGDFDKSVFPHWARKKYFSTNPIHDELSAVAQKRGVPEADLIRQITDSVRSESKIKSENPADYYDEGLRILEYEVQEGLPSSSAEPDYPELTPEGYPAAWQEQTSPENLFQVPQENLTQRYRRLVDEGKAQGLNPIQAIKYAKDKLAQPSQAVSGPKPQQIEFGAPGGVEGFGRGRQGEGELFELKNPYQIELEFDKNLDEAYLNSKPEIDQAYGGKEEFKKALKSLGENKGYSGDLRNLQKRMEIYREIKKKGFYGIVGSKVKNATDVADLTAIARNPAIEILQFAFLKDGKIVAHHAFTLGIPDFIPVPEALIKKINALSQELGADEVIGIHNHPSGNPTPSGRDGDIGLNNALIKRIKNYKYHIVHDHEEFAVIYPDGAYSFNKYSKAQPKYIPDGLVLANNSDKVASYANKNFKENTAMVMYLDMQNNIHAHEYLDLKSKNIGKFVGDRMRAYKVPRYIIALSPKESLPQSYVREMAYSLPAGLLDIVTLEKNGHTSLATNTGIPLFQPSAHAKGQFKGKDIFRFIEEASGLPIEKVNELMKLSEPAGEYLKSKIESPEFKKWFKDSKVVDENGKPLVVYHGTGTTITEFNPEFTGQGNAQYGPGFYFTISPENAYQYSIRESRFGNAQTIPAYVSIKNPIPLNKKVARGEIESLIKDAPDLNDMLANFGDVQFEGEKTVFNNAVNAYTGRSKSDAFDTIWHDFYKGREPEYLKAVLKLGFDGKIIDNGTIVAFSPEQIKSSIGNRGSFNPNDPNILREPGAPYGGGQLSRGSQPIDKFETIETPEEQKARSEFKLSDEALKIIKKYADRVGERYLPRGAQGVFHPETTNIRVNALNNLSTVSHEVTHYLDQEIGFTTKLLGTVGMSKTGNPIYDPKYRPIRKELTDIYVEYYPASLRSHRLKKRMKEGIATFLQKYVEMPKAIEEKYPKLVSTFLKPGGEFYRPDFPALIKDMHSVIADYQKLDPLQKIATRVTSEFQQGKIKDSFLNWQDKFVQETIDNKWPIEKLAKLGGVQRTQQDPSLWIRMYDNSSVPILNNIRGKRGFWVYKNGGFQKVSDNNIKTLVDALKAKGLTDDFGYWLVARRQHFDYLKLDELKRDADEAAAILSKIQPGEMLAGDIDELKKRIDDYKRLKQTLDKDAFDRNVVTQAYSKDAELFKPYADMFDKFNQSNLEMMADPEVGLLTPKQYAEYSAKDGYASFKRDVYDEIIGPEEPNLPQFRVGRTKVSSTIGRTGSELSIINPLASLVSDHAEVMRKSLKQIVYNKIAGLARQFPDLFQRQELKPSIDQRSGAILYPQERDPNIIIARGQNGERIPYLVSQEIKKIVDELLTYQNVGTLEMLMRTANRWFTKGTTGSYPLFAPTNFLIDQITATAQSRNKYIPVYDALKELYQSLIKRESADHQFEQEYLILGGERQTFAKWQDMEPGELIRAISGERTGLQKAQDIIEAGGNILALPSQMSEIVTRMAEYIKSRKAGNSQVVAMEDAGRVTVPFHHRGRYGSGTAGQTFVKSVPFMNPGIQALAQYYRSVNQGDTRNRALFTTLAVIAASVGASIYMIGNSTGDQKKAYKDLEANELANYLWLPSSNGKDLIRIRAPEQMLVFATLINMALWDSQMHARYTKGDYLDAATAFLPDQVDLTDPRRMFLSTLPQIIKPLVNVIYNKKDWPKPRPLVSLGLEYKEPRFQFNDNTSKFSKWLGDKLNLSPIKIDYLIEGYFGRITRFVTGKKISNPFIREWYFTAGRNLQDYYEMKQVTNALSNSLKHGDRPFTESEKEQIEDQKKKVSKIDKLLDKYRKPKKPMTEYDKELLRNEILDEVSMFRQGVKVQ